MLRLVLLPLAALVTQSLAKLYVHNSTFSPDEILRVTAENVTQGCESRYSVLVNGALFHNRIKALWT